MGSGILCICKGFQSLSLTYKRYYGTGKITHENYVQFIRYLWSLNPKTNIWCRHDALGFEYIDQSKNFVPQVGKVSPVLLLHLICCRQGTERLRHSEARWEELSDTYDQPVTMCYCFKIIKSLYLHFPGTIYWLKNISRGNILAEIYFQGQCISRKIFPGTIY